MQGGREFAQRYRVGNGRPGLCQQLLGRLRIKLKMPGNEALYGRVLHGELVVIGPGQFHEQSGNSEAHTHRRVDLCGRTAAGIQILAQAAQHLTNPRRRNAT